MTNDLILHMLRNRLRMVTERIAERQKQSEYSYEHRVFCDGAITELQDEARFLAGLIADIESAQPKRGQVREVRL